MQAPQTPASSIHNAFTMRNELHAKSVQWLSPQNGCCFCACGAIEITSKHVAPVDVAQSMLLQWMSPQQKDTLFTAQSCTEAYQEAMPAILFSTACHGGQEFQAVDYSSTVEGT